MSPLSAADALVEARDRARHILSDRWFAATCTCNNCVFAQAVRLLDGRVEDLEEALRRIVCLLQVDGRHDVTDRDTAVLAVALDQLGLDQPPPVHTSPGCVHREVAS